MRTFFLSSLKRLVTRTSPVRMSPADRAELMRDIADQHQDIIDKVQPYTMTSPLRIEALIKAVRYAIERGIPGAMVECGVWRGGSVLTMLLELLAQGVTDRDIYLYDTFEGMTQPTEKDVSRFHEPALETWRRKAKEGKQAWDYYFNHDLFNEKAVHDLLIATGYPEERLHFVRGRVEDTIPANIPDQIAILRLDTDWYESTRHELEYLYPRLQPGGVLIIDDYGHWEGARLAVDEYFRRKDVASVLLHRIDYAGRAAIKA